MSAVAEIEVLAPGFLTSVQDARGRPGFERYGVPNGGALDAFAARVANTLVGNPPEQAVLEITLVGPTLRFAATTTFALAGADFGAALDDQPVSGGMSWLARSGSVLAVGQARAGARLYLALAGGLQVPRVLGSHSTDLRAGFGGLHGRALRAGDRLSVPDLPDATTRAGRYLADPSPSPEPDAPIRVLPGPHRHRFAPGALAALCAQTWHVADQADRMGYRLAGQPLRHRAGADVTSLGLPVGAVQVPGDGRPIVLLADHPPTGGYTALACVIRADLRHLAQRVPGAPVRFALTTVEAARQALRAQHAALAAIRGDDLAW